MINRSDLFNRFKRQLAVFLSIVFAGFITHFYLFSNNLMNPDAIWLSDVYYSGWEVCSGRWGLLLLDRLHYGSTSPILMSLLTISFLALSAILLCEIFEIRSKLWYFIVGLLIVCSPFTSNIITYYYCSDAYAISFLMAIFSVYLTRKVQYAWKYPVCIALIAYSISIFQSSLGIICALYLLVLLDMASQGQSAAYTLKYIRDMVLLCILGLLVYLVILKLWLSVTGLTMLSYKGANQISLISTLKNLPKTIPAAYNDFYAFFFSSSTIIKNPISVKICYGVVFSLFLLSTLKILFSKKQHGCGLFYLYAFYQWLVIF